MIAFLQISVQLIVVFLVWRLLITMLRGRRRVQSAPQITHRKFIVIKAGGDAASGKATPTPTPAPTAV